MRGVYEASFQISALSAAKTLAYITAPSNKVVEILSASVTNADNETNEQLEIGWSKISTLGTPTGTTITPTKMEQGDQAASSTVKGNVTGSEPTYASAPSIEVGREGVPSLGGWRYAPVPEERLVIAGGDSWGLYNYNSITALKASVRIVFREIG
jgi:hypothetical protein